MTEGMTRRQRQAAEMKAKIQTTALELFDRKGFENVSIEKIARSVGCSVGNIYHYFPNKDSLTVLLTDHVDVKYRALADEYAARGDSDTPLERLIDFSGRALEIDSGEDLLYQAFVHSIRYPEQGFLKVDERKEYFRLLRSLVHTVSESYDLAEGVSEEQIMHAFVILNRGVLIEWRIEEAGFDIGAKGRILARALLEGFMKR